MKHHVQKLFSQLRECGVHSNFGNVEPRFGSSLGVEIEGFRGHVLICCVSFFSGGRVRALGFRFYYYRSKFDPCLGFGVARRRRLQKSTQS